MTKPTKTLVEFPRQSARDVLTEVLRTGARQLLAALLHESSLARTMPPDRILTCRYDMTLAGRARSSD